MNTDREIWAGSFSNKDEIDKFSTKPGPPLSEEQIKKRKEQLEKIKEEKLLESLQDQINILKETVERLENAFKKTLLNTRKPKTVVVENESKITKKETE